MTITATRAATLRVAVYARESKDKAGDAHNVADQLAELDAHLAAHGWEAGPGRRFVDNDRSATDGKPRPRFNALMRLVDQRQIDVILVRHADRLYRKVAELETILARCERAGVEIVTLAGRLDLSTPNGRAVARLWAVMAQHETELKAERQAMAARQAAARGKARTNAPRPFGWEEDRVTRRPAEAAAIEWAAGYLISQGNVTGVAREWARRGLRPAQQRDGKWTRASVVTIMTSPRLAGYAAYLAEADRRALRDAGRPRPLHAPVLTGDDGRPVTGQWEPILAPEVWDAVAAVLADPGRKPSRKGRSGVRTLGGGLFRCPCGNVVSANHVTRLGYSQYRCQPATRAGQPGPHTAQRMDPVDDFVARVIIERLSRPDAAGLITPARPDLAPLRIEQGNKRAALVRLGEDYDNDVITREEWLARRGRLTTRLAEIDTALAAAEAGSVLAPFASGEAAAVWAGLDLPQRRAVIGALAQVAVLPAGRGAREFNPDTVKITWHGNEPDATG